MKTIENYYLPRSAREAVAALNKPGAMNALVCGGTQLVPHLPNDIGGIVDLRLAGLSYVKADSKFLRIGAAATFTDLLDSKPVKSWAGGMLYDAAYTVSSQLVRNMGTIGGNIVRPYPYNNIPPVLLALDAEFVAAGKSGPAVFAAKEMFNEKLFAALGRKSVLTEIRIPARTKNWRGTFMKFAKAPSMWECYALICAALEIKGGVCRQARLAAGAAVARARRFESAEALLSGAKITPELARRAAGAAVSEIEHFTPIQSSPAYKKQVLPVLLARAIERAAEGE